MWALALGLAGVGALLGLLLWATRAFLVWIYGDPEIGSSAVPAPGLPRGLLKLRDLLAMGWFAGLAVIFVVAVAFAVYMARGALAGYAPSQEAFQKAPAVAASIAQEAATAADVAAQHGQNMVSLGERMIARSKSSGNQVWEVNGSHWVADGKRVIELAQSAKSLADRFAKLAQRQGDKDIGTTDVFGLNKDAHALVTYSQGLVEHGKVMLDLSMFLLRQAQEAGDPDLMKDAGESVFQSEKMAEAAASLLSASQKAAAEADRLRALVGQ